MTVNKNYYCINIRKMLSDNPELGEENLNQLLSEFSCPKNLDVEHFLKKNAIEFTKKNQSVTYLVFDVNNDDFVGYFTIALKSLTIRGETISKTTKKKIERISELHKDTQTYTMSAYLIAQLGKNYAKEINKKIRGSELLQLALDVIEEVKYKCGGFLVFLEADNSEKLLNFYKDNSFQIFDTRMSSSDFTEKHELIQMLRLI